LAEGILEIKDVGGATVWFKNMITSPVLIEYDVQVIDQGGEFDRLSDLNCFWMATDPCNPDDIFANSSKRDGSFKNYHGMRLYYVGLGGNDNTSTRFRRYPGDGTRPLLKEHDLKQKKFLLEANKIYHIELVANENTIQYIRDGEVIFDFYDPAPYKKGWFGFRTVKSHLKIDNFKVWQIQNNN